MFLKTALFSGVLLWLVLLQNVGGDTIFFPKATKNVPRVGRRSEADFENFFLKASKSVPRIGRRSDNEMDSYLPQDDYYLWMKPKYVSKPGKRYDDSKLWYDLANRVEYEPEIMFSPSLWASESADQDGGDSFEPPRSKRVAESANNGEIPENRLQA